VPTSTLTHAHSQAMPLRVDSGSQCAWRRSVNKASQSESVRLSEAAAHQILHSNALSSFLLRALPLCANLIIPFIRPLTLLRS
jgi:hypothetical protein